MWTCPACTSMFAAAWPRYPYALCKQCYYTPHIVKAYREMKEASVDYAGPTGHPGPSGTPGVIPTALPADPDTLAKELRLAARLKFLVSPYDRDKSFIEEELNPHSDLSYAVQDNPVRPGPDMYMVIERQFTRYLKCSHCDEETTLTAIMHANDYSFRWTDFECRAICPSCKLHGVMEVVDRPGKNGHNNLVVRTFPKKEIIVCRDKFTGQIVNVWKIPDQTVSEIYEGNYARLTCEPWEVIESVRRNVQSAEKYMQFNHGVPLAVYNSDKELTRTFHSEDPDFFRVKLATFEGDVCLGNAPEDMFCRGPMNPADAELNYMFRNHVADDGIRLKGQRISSGNEWKTTNPCGEIPAGKPEIAWSAPDGRTSEQHLELMELKEHYERYRGENKPALPTDRIAPADYKAGEYDIAAPAAKPVTMLDPPDTTPLTTDIHDPSVPEDAFDCVIIDHLTPPLQGGDQFYLDCLKDLVGFHAVHFTISPGYSDEEFKRRVMDKMTCDYHYDSRERRDAQNRKHFADCWFSTVDEFKNEGKIIRDYTEYTYRRIVPPLGHGEAIEFKGQTADRVDYGPSSMAAQFKRWNDKRAEEEFAKAILGPAYPIENDWKLDPPPIQISDDELDRSIPHPPFAWRTGASGLVTVDIRGYDKEVIENLSPAEWDALSQALRVNSVPTYRPKHPGEVRVAGDLIKRSKKEMDEEIRQLNAAAGEPVE